MKSHSDVVLHRQRRKLNLLAGFERWHSTVWTSSTAEGISEIALQHSKLAMSPLTVQLTVIFSNYITAIIEAEDYQTDY